MKNNVYDMLFKKYILKINTLNLPLDGSVKRVIVSKTQLLCFEQLSALSLS